MTTITEQKTLRVKSVKNITHDVLHLVTERPQGINFEPGQAAEISIDKDGWRDEKRPFTFTSLPDNDFLEFMIKTYPSRNGVTNELLNVKKDDSLIVHDVFGTIAYNGKGFFIAGGAGITPFISIFRHLNSIDQLGGNTLIFANKTKSDIIVEDELSKLLGKRFINILSDEEIEGYAHGLISEAFLKKHIAEFGHYFYLCGPPPMMESVEKQLLNVGVNEKMIVKESF